jgi:hypothetical protein
MRPFLILSAFPLLTFRARATKRNSIDPISRDQDREITNSRAPSTTATTASFTEFSQIEVVSLA